MITSQLKTDLIFKKQLSIKYATSNHYYEAFKRTIEVSPTLYPHDFHVYNDDIRNRHLRNIREINYLKQLIQQGKISTQMLQFNTLNTFYPSYVLDHHYHTFLPIISALTINNSQINELVQLGKKGGMLGAFLRERQTVDCSVEKREIPMLNEVGCIEMDKNDYYYSTVSHPYLSHCMFRVTSKSGDRLALFQMRDANGNFKKQIGTKDFGSLTSSDYLSIGFNFTGAKPILIISIDEGIDKKIKMLCAQQKLHEFQYSLRDLQKSLWLTIKYTGMRRQFSTLQKSKEQRKIITYQSVASRIVRAFAQYMAFTNLNMTIHENPQAVLALEQLLPSAHHVILQQLIHLRECCGGFGYMQFSGHPGCIERVAFRASLEKKKQLKLSPIFIQATQYYTSSEQAQKFYRQPVGQSISYMGYFGLFISICASMRRNHDNMHYLSFKREYLRQSSIFSMHIKQEYSRNLPNSIHSKLHQYLIYAYILKNPSFTPQNLIQNKKVEFYQRLQLLQNKLLEEISAQLMELGQTLQLGYLRNVIVGRKEEQNFYSQLLQRSNDNLRNGDGYRGDVNVDIVTMLRGQLARL